MKPEISKKEIDEYVDLLKKIKNNELMMQTISSLIFDAQQSSKQDEREEFLDTINYEIKIWYDIPLNPHQQAILAELNDIKKYIEGKK